MSEEKKDQEIEKPETADVPKVDPVKQIEDQEKKVAGLEKVLADDPNDALEIELYRERDLLRHLRQVQKGKPKERATMTANYAAKAALSRAIQPVEE